MKPRAHAISAQEFGESGQHRIPPKCVTPRNQESGIRNQESESRSKCWNQESGIRNQESESRSKCGRSDKSGIRNKESNGASKKRDRRIGRGEQNQELALAALENRKGSGGNENGESGS